MQALVEIVLNTTIQHVEFAQPEHDLYVLPQTRAGRLDLYVVDDQGRNYDVEIQAESNRNEVMRARHYQSLMDAMQLRKGTPVVDLPNSVIIFICDFDPLNEGLRWYDCRTVCLQTQKVVEDGRRFVFLNARGTAGNVSPELDAFLRYVAGDKVDGDAFVDEINDTIDAYITNPGWMEQYMSFEDELAAARLHAEECGFAAGEKKGYDSGMQKGMQEGMREGMQKGMQEGMREGMQKGMQKGMHENALVLAVKLVRDGIMELPEAAAFAEVNQDELASALDNVE